MSSMLDIYLIIQALGWNYDLGSIILVYLILFGIAVLIIVSGGLLAIYLD